MPKCEWPICSKESLPGKKYCYPHGRLNKEVTAKPPPVPIPKKSEKRKVEDRELKKMFDERFAIDPNCQIKIPGICTGMAQCFDHIQKTSPKNRLKPENLIMSCGACNSAKEGAEGQKWAIENGFHVSRFKK